MQPADTSNPLRLSPREWLVALGLLAVLCPGLPVVWARLEPLPDGADARIPYGLGSDYWIFGRYSHQPEHSVLALGDSVVWGHYVRTEETLTAQLNRLSPRAAFVNLGVDGIHPAAMTGLLEYYGRAISGRRVILHCNPLWMTSARRDLTTDKEENFNHPALVPQFRPWLNVYSAPLAERIGIVVGHQVPLLQWSRHLEIADFDSKDVTGWTLERPYASPVRQITFKLPGPNQPPEPPPVAEPWTAAGGRPVSFPWVDLATSFQWRSFQDSVRLLQNRGNRVFVLVGPFNEHMLTDRTRKAYQRLKNEIHAWLDAQKIPHAMAQLLPSELYADASHPLAAGYAALAKDLTADEAFRRYLGD